MKIFHSLLVVSLILFACQSTHKSKVPDTKTEVSIHLDSQQAFRLSQLPLRCIHQYYPNKPGMVLADSSDLGQPQDLHPAFYGCFDWHSSVHGHWVLVYLLKNFPELSNVDEITNLLKAQLTAENIAGELAYFNRSTETSFERTYGWAWLLKLAEETYTWDTDLGRELYSNLKPLADLIIYRYTDYLPRLVYPIRTGEHPNTAFGLTFAWDYAQATGDVVFSDLIAATALRFYAADAGCPVWWEPSGHDFLSPCFEEIDIMRRVLDSGEFETWLAQFMPELLSSNFALEPGVVLDRTDGKLVHLDGLNFSRAWCLLGIANQSEKYSHLRNVAYAHIQYSLPQIVDGAYEGEHWLASFALYALSQI